MFRGHTTCMYCMDKILLRDRVEREREREREGEGERERLIDLILC